MITPEELKRLKGICERASPKAKHEKILTTQSNCPKCKQPSCFDGECINYFCEAYIQPDNLEQETLAEFHAEARTAMPLLIAEVERLKEENKRWEELNEMEACLVNRRDTEKLREENCRLKEALDHKWSREALGGGGE